MNKTLIVGIVCISVIIALITLLILLIWYTNKDDDTPKQSHTPSSDPDTTDVTPVPEDTAVSVSRRITDGSHVPSDISMNEPKIELYTGKGFAGSSRFLYPGMKTQFAEMKNNELKWQYQSMKVAPGTYIMLTSSVSGRTDRGFAVGKHDVPDMYSFITSYDSIYNQRGIFMDRNYWARPFYIQVLTDEQWDDERQKKYDYCIRQAVSRWRYTKQRAVNYCEYAKPESSMNNITGFRNGIRGGLSRTGSHSEKEYY